MKKKLSIAIASLLVVSLVSCGGTEKENNNTADSGNKDTSIVEVDETEENESDVEDDEDSEDSDEDAQDEDYEDFETPKIDSGATIIEPTVIFDKNGIKVTADNLAYNSYEATMDITIENNSDVAYSYYAGAGGYACNSINGYMFNGGYATGDVEGGKKAIETVKFSYDEMFIYGIDKIAEIQLGIMFEDDDYNKIYGGDVPIKTTAYDGYDLTKNYFSDQIKSKAIEKAYNCSIEDYKEEEFMNSDSVKIISAMTLTNKDGEKSLMLDVYNDSDEILYVDFDDLSINGLGMPYSLYGGGYVLPKKHYITSPEIYDDDVWTVLGIEKANLIQFVTELSNSTHNEQASIDSKNKVSIKYNDDTADIFSSGKEILNNNYVRVVAKGFMEDYDDLVMYLVCENKTGNPIVIRDEDDSMSINDIMTDYSYYSTKLEPNAIVTLKYRIDGDSLEKNKIASEDDINKLEVSIEISDDSYHELEKVKMIYEK